MTETLSVSISGTALSFLLFENFKNNYFQDGFLIGELVQKETKKITDNDHVQLHISRTIRISTAVPCPEPHFFYDGAGKVDAEKIRNFLGELSTKVVAWYRFRQSSNFNLSFRENLIHKQLANLFSLPLEYFSCCLLASETSDNRSTHSFRQTFVRSHNSKYEELPIHIVNLSDANNTYKSPEQVSEIFSKIVGALKINNRKNWGFNTITEIQNAVQKSTDQLVEELAEKEKRLFDLEQEVNKLKQSAKDKNVTSASNDEKMDTVLELYTPTKLKKTPDVKKTSPGSHDMVTRLKKKERKEN